MNTDQFFLIDMNHLIIVQKIKTILNEFKKDFFIFLYDNFSLLPPKMIFLSMCSFLHPIVLSTICPFTNQFIRRFIHPLDPQKSIVPLLMMVALHTID